MVYTITYLRVRENPYSFSYSYKPTCYKRFNNLANCR